MSLTTNLSSSLFLFSVDPETLMKKLRYLRFIRGTSHIFVERKIPGTLCEGRVRSRIKDV